MSLKDMTRRKALGVLSGIAAVGSVGFASAGSGDDEPIDLDEETHDSDDIYEPDAVDDLTLRFEDCATVVVEDAPDEADTVDIDAVWYLDDGEESSVLTYDLDELPLRIEGNTDPKTEGRVTAVAMQTVRVFDDNEAEFDETVVNPDEDRCLALVEGQWLLWQLVHDEIDLSDAASRAKEVVGDRFAGHLDLSIGKDDVTVVYERAKDQYL